MKQPLNEQFSRMQKLAGIITENKINEVEEVTPEKVVDATEKISDTLAQDPEQLKQSLAKAKQLGISIDMVKQAANQLKQGKSPEEVFKSISNQVQETLNEISVSDAQKKDFWEAIIGGSGLGFGAGVLGMIVAGPTFLPAAILALAGAVLGYNTRDKKSGGSVPDDRMIYQAAWEFKNQMLDQGRKNVLPNVNLFYIVDNGDTPKELEGKEIWRLKIADRDIVGDKDALFKSSGRADLGYVGK